MRCLVNPSPNSDTKLCAICCRLLCPVTNPVLTEPLSDTESGHIGEDGKPSTDNETEAVSYNWTAFHTVLICGK